MPRTILLAGVALSVTATSCATVHTAVGPCPKEIVRQWPIQIARFEKVRAESTAEAEAKNVVDGVPFGGLHEQWSRLKNEMREGDVLLWFASPRGCYLCGAQEGYVVMRGCEQGPNVVLVWD